MDAGLPTCHIPSVVDASSLRIDWVKVTARSAIHHRHPQAVALDVTSGMNCPLVPRPVSMAKWSAGHERVYNSSIKYNIYIYVVEIMRVAKQE